MSLLMKALEKAAKDRGEGPAQAATRPPLVEPRPEVSLALELLAADTPSPRMKEDAAPQSRAAAKTPASAALRENAGARAGVGIRVGESAASGPAAYVRTHPVVVFGALAALFALGFGTYVYLQIYHPALFLRQPQPPVTPNLLAQAPPAPAPSQSAEAPPTAAPLAPQLIPSAPLLRSEPLPERPLPPFPPAAAPAPKPKPAPAAQKPATAPPRDTVLVSPGNAAPTINPMLAEAYAALQAGRFEAAEALYTRLVEGAPRDIDALLGLAAIALRDGRSDDAVRRYLEILEIDPRNAFAQSGLIGLRGGADPLAAETRLKHLIAREPSDFLYFTLGNLYADQSLWAQAQQAYFQAYHLESGNPDYAYNLAVSLEHLAQPNLALGFYRRAEELAVSRGHANFDPVRVRERIATLSRRLE
jgi:tetratricopeptide (TPR) repeat protein